MITEPKHSIERTPASVMADATGGSSGPSLPSIEFRVLRSGTPARRLRLNTARCTLGSGEGCTVRLSDPSLRPMHAVILRDDHRVLLRAYTVPIEVNGHLTGESFLHLGDSFTLGSYRFELIETADFNDETSGGFYRPRVNRTETVLPAAVASRDVLPQQAETPVLTRPRRSRLSFVGGSTYVSEALQAVPSRGESVNEQRRTLRLSEPDDSDALQDELDSWRKQEQQWQAQDKQTRAELADAIAQYRESQQRAQEAAEVISQMRQRMSQLTEELQTLAKDAVDFRKQATERQEDLQRAADEANSACEEALRQREEVALRLEQLTTQCEVAIREQDELPLAGSSLNAPATILQDARESAPTPAQQINVGPNDAVVQEEIEALTQRAVSAESTLAETKQELERLSNQFHETSERLRQAREEVTAAYQRIETLTQQNQSLQANVEAATQRQATVDQQHQVQLEQLRREIKHLEEDCATSRLHAASASNDRQIAQSLQARLESAEAARNQDRLSWEAEANTLQEMIHQISVELAAATGRLSQTEAERQAIRAELDITQQRLSSTDLELAARPTIAQWNELQEQLQQAQTLLEQTEQQLATLRAEYDGLLAQQPSAPERQYRELPVSPAPASPAPANSAPASPAASITPASSAGIFSPGVFSPGVSGAEIQRSELASTSEAVSAAPWAAPLDGEESLDQLWPTYGTAADPHNLPLDCDDNGCSIDNRSPTQAEFLTSDPADVFNRLQSYTSHDQGHRSPGELEPVQDDKPNQPLADPALTGWSALLAASKRNDVAGDVPDSVEAPEPSDESRRPSSSPPSESLGMLAKQLIAQLDEAKDQDEHSDSHSVSQSHGEWMASSTVWDRIQQTSGDTDTVRDRKPDAQQSFADDQDVDFDKPASMSSSSVWNFASSMKAEEGRGYEDDESLGEDPDHAMEGHTFVMPSDSPAVTDRFESPMRAGVQAEFANAFRDTDSELQPSYDSADDDSQTRAFDFAEHAGLLRSTEPEPEVEREAPPVSSYQESRHRQEPEDTDEDSIEAYMNRLLQRVQGSSGSPTTSSTKESASSYSVTTSKTASSTVNAVTEPTSVTMSKSTEVIDANAPLVPRSQAPERADNLAAMRELANASANSAISVSVRSQAVQLKSRAIMDLLQAGVVMVCAFAFYTCGLKIPNLQMVWFTAATLAFALSIFFVFDMLKKLAAARASYERAVRDSDEDDFDDDFDLDRDN